MLKSKLPTIFAVAVLLNVAVGGYIFSHSTRPPAKRLGVIAEEYFNAALTDTNGEPFSLSRLKGKVWVIDFIFTTCGSVCPLMTQNLSGIRQSLRYDPRLHFVSVTVNPEFDSPEVLSAYAKKYQADPSRWHFLTGSRRDIQNLAVGGFKIGSVDEPVFHSTSFVLVDQNGSIRGYYDGTNPLSVQNLIRDLSDLLNPHGYNSLSKN